MDAALDIGADGPAVEVKSTIGDDTVVTATSVAAVDFLKEYPAAKIVIIVDTHCLDTGAFVWRGDSPVSYETCTLPEVSATLYSLFFFDSHTLHTDRWGLYPKEYWSIFL
jgi:hypothetical protein